MPKLKNAIPKVNMPTVFGGSDSAKLKPKNVQIKVKKGSNSCLIFLRFVIVASPYDKPSTIKNTPMNL